MACRETTVDFLRDNGYTPIRTPRERIQPLDLIGKLPGGGTPKQLTSLKKIMIPRPDAPDPEVIRDEAVSQLAGKKTDRLDIGIGLNLLGTIFRALGGVSASLSAAFKNARQVEFLYEDVLSDFVDIGDLLDYLGKRPSLNHKNPLIEKYFLGDGQVVVITRVLKSNAFSVVASDEKGRKVDIEVNVLQKELAKGGIQASKDSEMKVSFKGSKHLVFAFQGFMLHIDTGGLNISEDIPAEMGIFATKAATRGQPQPVVLSRSGLLSLD